MAWSRTDKSESWVLRSTCSMGNHKTSVNEHNVKLRAWRKLIYICQERCIWHLQTLTGDLIFVNEVLLNRRFWVENVRRSNKIWTQRPSPSKGNMRQHTLSAARWWWPPPGSQLWTAPASVFFPLNLILSSILSTLWEDVGKMPTLCNALRKKTPPQ